MKKLLFLLRNSFDQLKEDFIVQVMDGYIGVYFSSSGIIGDLVIELKDERIKKSELDTLVATGDTTGSGEMRIRGVGDVTSDSNTNYCIQIESSDGCSGRMWYKDSFTLLHNNIEKARISPREIYFKTFNFCLPSNYVDVERDQFTLSTKSRDRVSAITLKLFLWLLI